MWFETFNYPYYHELKFSQKYGRFYEVNWKFVLLLLSRDKILAKIRQFCWTDSKIWTASIMKSFNFLKSKGFMISPENLNCTYYYEPKFLRKYPIFNYDIWTFELPPYSWVLILSNISQFWWCLFPCLTFPYYQKEKFSLK